MASDTDVIREFLVSLGFKVDQNGLKKFTTGLASTTASSLATGKAVLGVALAAEAMVVSFSSSMEKLYYASRRTGASVENIQAVEFGSRKIGLAAGEARAALESMASAARMNPGIRGLMDGLLGKDTSKLDQAQVMLDLVQKLATMPHYVGAQFAQMIGMDEKTFLMLKDGLPELIKAEQERRDLNKQAGIDAQSAAAAGHEYANSIRDITERVGVLRDRLAIEMLPSFRDFNKEVVTALDGLAKFKLAEHPTLKSVVDGGGNLKDSVSTLNKGIWGLDGAQMWEGFKGVLKNSPGAGLASRGGALIGKGFDAFNAWRDGDRPGGYRSKVPATGDPNVDSHTPINPFSSKNKAELPPAGSPEAGKLFAKLEKQYSLPDGLLDKIWYLESRRGKNMLSPKGAKGHFGLMDGTASDLGVTDPSDLAQSAAGAAKYFSQLMKRYGGSQTMAAAAYNWGMGNLEKKGIDAAPFETRNYVNSIAGSGASSSRPVTINQKTDIHVNGGDNPQATGRAVQLVQDEVTGTMVRNLGGAVR